VNFAYLPVNHVNATSGKYICEVDGEDLDCEGTKFDTCLVSTYCWYGNCSRSTQRQISKFLKCFEGPYANTELVPDISRRQPCMHEAGLDFEKVQNCATTPSQVNQLMGTLNASKSSMMASLGPNPGYFPHIFVNGVHLGNFSWVSLLRTVCNALETQLSSSWSWIPQADADSHKMKMDANQSLQACSNASFQGSFTLTSSLSAATYSVQIEAFVHALSSALNMATSNASLPIHYMSYANLQAVTGLRVQLQGGSPRPFLNPASGLMSETAAQPELGLGFPLKKTLVDFQMSILTPFGNDCIRGCMFKNHGPFAAFLHTALVEEGFNLDASTLTVVSNVHFKEVDGA